MRAALQEYSTDMRFSHGVKLFLSRVFHAHSGPEAFRLLRGPMGMGTGGKGFRQLKLTECCINLPSPSPETLRAFSAQHSVDPDYVSGISRPRIQKFAERLEDTALGKLCEDFLRVILALDATDLGVRACYHTCMC